MTEVERKAAAFDWIMRGYIRCWYNLNEYAFGTTPNRRQFRWSFQQRHQQGLFSSALEAVEAAMGKHVDLERKADERARTQGSGF